MKIPDGDFDGTELLERNRIMVHPPGPFTRGEIDTTPDLLCTVEVPFGQVLHTEQRHLHLPSLEHYRQRGIAGTAPGRAWQSDHDSDDLPHRPTVVDYQGKRWVADGHNRLVASRGRGEPFLIAWHVDPERDRREYEEWAAGRSTSKEATR